MNFNKGIEAHAVLTFQEIMMEISSSQRLTELGPDLTLISVQQCWKNWMSDSDQKTQGGVKLSHVKVLERLKNHSRLAHQIRIFRGDDY